MTYWDEIKKKVQKNIDKASEEVKKNVDLAYSKVKDETSFLQFKTNLYLKQRELRNLLADLGDKTQALYKEKKEIIKDEAFKEIMDYVEKKEKECKALEEKIEKLKKK